MRYKIALLICLLVGVGTAVSGADIHFLTHSLNSATYLDEDGNLRGRPHAGRRAFYVEVVHAMMAERGMISSIEEVSLGRGFHLLAGQEGYAFFNVIRNEQRRDLYKWVGPIDIFPTYFYELKAAPTGIQSMDDARNVRSICVLNGNNLVSLLDGLGFKNLLRANSSDACTKLLRYKRVSLVTGSEFPWFMNNSELSEALARTPVTISVNEGFIAFSRAVEDKEIAAWQAALDAVKASGTYEKLRTMHLRPNGE